jgi:hypothetical protein
MRHGAVNAATEAELQQVRAALYLADGRAQEALCRLEAREALLDACHNHFDEVLEGAGVLTRAIVAPCGPRPPGRLCSYLGGNLV